MKILATDTSTPFNAVAVYEVDQDARFDMGYVLAESLSHAGRRHSERLLAVVDIVLEEAQLRLADIDLLAVSTGPGSFTGLRVGLATWKGLAFGTNLPLIGVPTLDALTRLSCFHDETVCTLLDAKMSEVFGAVYRYEGSTREKVVPDRVLPVEGFLTELDGDVLFLGDGAELYRDQVMEALPDARFAPATCMAPRGAAVAIEAASLYRAGVDSDPGAVVASYLRLSQAEVLRAKKLEEAST